MGSATLNVRSLTQLATTPEKCEPALRRKRPLMLEVAQPCPRPLLSPADEVIE
jgi:hypothetical protein